MKLKPITAMIVLSLIVVSLIVSGCLSSTNSNQAASSASQAASTTANITASASASASARPTPTPTATPTPTPTATPTPTPTPPVTGSFGQSTYVVANGTVITATVSNWKSNPDVGLGLSTNHAPLPMQPIGNGVYSFTLEDVVIIVHGTGSGGISLWDNGVIVAYANTTWTNP
jgi:outer membrane murein-binding lipoprotein Lpp